MPKKPNHAGQMQEYVPAGNGDASGEYGDSGGSNKHFTAFKQPEGEQKEKLSVVSGQPKEKEFDYQKASEKIQNITKGFNELNGESVKRQIHVQYKNKQLKILNDDQWNNRSYRTYDEMMTYYKINNVINLDAEQRKKFVELAVENSDLCSSMPNFQDDEKSLLSLLPDTTEGKANLIRMLGFGDYKQEDSLLVQRLFEDMYKEELEEIESKVKDKVNTIRAKLGKKFVDENFKKVNNGFSMNEALKKANPKYWDEVYDETYHTNCQRCSFTYELLRRGYDVVANPNDDNYGKNRKWTAQMCWKDKYSIDASNYKGAKKQIDDIIKNAGNGARFCLAVQWKSASGHCFIGENVNGEVKYIDAQDGSYSCDDYFSRIQSKSPIFVGRMDNADFSQSIKYGARGSE